MDALNPRFHTTHWSVVLAAGGDGGEERRAALRELCAAYWYPLYAYARRRGLSREDAEDRAQSFFAALLEKEWVGRADPERGRFRAFLLTAFRRHLGRERDRERAQRRGGGRRPLRLDFDEGERRYALEPAHADTPERLFDRRWALTLLERAVDAVGAEMAATGKAPLFEALRSRLLDDGSAETHAAVADRLGMTPGAVKVAAYRLRQRFRDRLRAEVADTVDAPGAVDDEIRALLAAL